MEWKNRTAYLLAKTEPGKSSKVWETIQSWPQAIGGWVVTGDWDVLLWADAWSWDEVYDTAAKLRKTPGVAKTSSHWVHEGWKNGSWWWDWAAGTWVFWRGRNLNGSTAKNRDWKWVVSSASLPGDWDWLTWVGGKNWDEVWKNVMEFQKSGRETSTIVPVKSWWNKKWAKEWAELAAGVAQR